MIIIHKYDAKLQLLITGVVGDKIIYFKHSDRPLCSCEAVTEISQNIEYKYDYFVKPYRNIIGTIPSKATIYIYITIPIV